MEKSDNTHLFYFVKARFFKFFRKNNILKNLENNTDIIIRIPIAVDSLWKFDPFLTKNLLENPTFCFPIMKEALNIFLKNITVYKNIKKKNFIPDLQGPFGRKNCRLNELNASFLGEIVCVRATVVKKGETKTKLERSVHYSNTSGKFFVKEYSDQVSSALVKVVDHKNENTLELEYGLSKFNDWQTILLEDCLDEKLSSFPLNNSIAVLENDLANICNINDHVEICAIYKPLMLSASNANCCSPPTILCVLSIKNIFQSQKKIPTRFDYFIMKNFSLLANSFDRLSSLVAPKIFGNNLIKKGIILFLMSGNSTKKSKEEINSRQINVLMLGQEAFDKKEYFKFFYKICPETVFIRGDTLDQQKSNFTKPSFEMFIQNKQNKCYESVDNKIICIDDLDRISLYEKNFIKEIMEQKMITSSKNGIFTSSVSNCGIFATSQNLKIFNETSYRFENSNQISNSIIRRFDLTFNCFDNFSVNEDKKKANRILISYKNCTALNFSRKSRKKTDKKYKRKSRHRCNTLNFSTQFLKMYLKFAQNNIYPKISNEAASLLLVSYIEKLKRISSESSFAIKKLECIIKLSCSFVKSQLRSVVVSKDVKKILNYLNAIHNSEQQSKNWSEYKDKKTFLNTKRLILLKEKEFSDTQKNSMINRVIGSEVFQEKLNIFHIATFRHRHICLRFVDAKKQLLDRKNCAVFERFVSNWIKQRFCLVFDNKIIAI